MTLDFSEIKSFDDANSELENLYLESFPPVETRPISKLNELLKIQSNYHLFIVKENDSIIGFALVYILSNHNVSLLDYLAIDPAYQRKGIGSKLLQYCIDATKSYSSSLLGMILELERDDLEDSAENQRRKDRINFYARYGAKKFENTSYFIPPQSGNIPVKLYLMIIPYQEFDSLPKQKVISFAQEMHSEIYHYKKNDLNEKMAEDLPDPVKLVSLNEHSSIPN